MQRFRYNAKIVLPAIMIICVASAAFLWYWTQVTASPYLSTFELVWQTVNEEYFDPTFGGLDWDEVHDRYQPMIAAAKNDDEFYSLINTMLFELNVSHLAVIRPEDWERILPTVVAEGSIGINIRLLDDEAVITSVKPGSPSDRADLLPGFVLQSIDGVPIEQIVREGEAEIPFFPPFNNRNERNIVTRYVLSPLYGPPQTNVSIVYLDELGETHEKTIMRTGNRTSYENDPLPPYFLELESKRLPSNIGYIRFNSFHPALTQDILSTIESMNDTRGLIFDLRGNAGGSMQMIYTLAESLVEERRTFLRVKERSGTSNIVLDPAEEVYKEPIIVLIDIMSLSASEVFAAGMQAIGRAMIIGERSPGYALVANQMELPNGAILMYAIAQTSTPDGTILEDHGVIPDVEVSLDRASLLQGCDSQLEEAIRYITEEMQQ